MGLRQFFDRRAAAVLATLVAFLLTGCGGGSTSTPAPVQPAPAITVALTPASATVQTGQSQSFTATISNDTQNKGVTWTLSGQGCSGSTCGAISGASGATIMYGAPAAAPTPPTVTLTATSVTDGTKSSTATITISAPAAPPPAIVVAVTPSMSTVQTGASQVFSATVQNDAQNKGVNWSLSLAAAACPVNTCGTVSPATSLSGANVNYTAPATAPAGPITLTATSIADPTKSAAASITVTAPAKITVTVSPTTANVATGAALQTFTATLQNDTQSKGVNWSLSISGSACAASACGSVSPASTLSGATATYTSPASAAVPATVALMATSVVDRTVSAIATITLTAPAAPTPSHALFLGLGQVDAGYGEPVIATDTAANIDVAWVNGNGPQFVRSTDGGNTFSTPPVNIPSDLSNTLNAQNNIQMGLDVTGHINLLWHRNLTSTSTVPGSFFSRSTNGGTTFSTPVNPSGATAAQLAVSPNGTITIVWFDPATSNLFAVNSTDGANFSVPVTVSPAVPNTHDMDLIVVPGPQTQLYIFWTQVGSSMTNCSIQFSSSMDGSTFTPAATISGGAGSCNQVPVAAIDSTSGINVAWAADGASLFFSRSTNGGSTFSKPASIPTSPKPTSQRLAVGTDGTIYILWEAGSVLFSRSVDGGATFSVMPTSLSLAAGISPPAMGIDACSNVTAVGQGNQIRTVYQRSMDGGLTFPVPIDISAFAGEYEQQLAIDKNGNVHIVWGVDGPPDIEYVHIPTTCSAH
jgi:hypothetical protein